MHNPSTFSLTDFPPNDVVIVDENRLAVINVVGDKKYLQTIVASILRGALGPAWDYDSVNLAFVDPKSYRPATLEDFEIYRLKFDPRYYRIVDKLETMV